MKSEIDQSLLTSAATNAIPRSSFIKEIRWAPVETIRRAARGSDNWPLTWADDDALYGAYGDGNGFEPFTAEKLSMGFARITGGPVRLRRDESSLAHGRNARQRTRRQESQRPALRGRHPLPLDAQRHQFAARLVGRPRRDVDVGRLAIHRKFRLPDVPELRAGTTRRPATNSFTSIHPTNSAYETADQLVLARAPKTRLRDRASYEFFSGVDGAGKPQWTRDHAQRQAVFTHAGHCYRSRISYNAALRRYLLVQPVPGIASRDQTGRLDTRSNGGLAIYDAPEPWGPWTTVFFTDHWDVGPGDSASFPTKWMSADGTTLHLVFSGDDCFSVRRATLVPAQRSDSFKRETAK